MDNFEEQLTFEYFSHILIRNFILCFKFLSTQTLFYNSYFNLDSVQDY